MSVHCILTRIEEVHTLMGIDDADDDVRIVDKGNIYNTRHLFIQSRLPLEKSAGQFSPLLWDGSLTGFFLLVHFLQLILNV